MQASDGYTNVFVTRHACSHLGWRFAFADEHPTREYTPIPFATCVYNSRHVRLLNALRVLTQSTRMYTTSEVRGASRGGCGGDGVCTHSEHVSRDRLHVRRGGVRYDAISRTCNFRVAIPMRARIGMHREGSIERCNTDLVCCETSGHAYA